MSDASGPVPADELERRVEERTSALVQANARLREREIQFRRALNIRTVGVLFFCLDGRMMDANEAFERMSGYRADELRSSVHWKALTPAEFADVTRQASDELAGSGQTSPYEKQLIRKDGSRFWALCAPTRLNGHGAQSECVEFIIDISEQKRAEAALRESERRFRTLAEGVPQLVFRSRGSGERTWASPQWVAFTGLSAAESVGLGWLAAIHPDDRPVTMAAWAEAERHGTFSVDHRVRSVADGGYRWFQSHASPLRGQPGSADAAEWLGTSTDIEDQVRAREVLTRSQSELETLVAERTAELMAAEEALRHSQKMDAVGRLTGGIAHDFNNMLQGISGGLETARRRIAQGRAADAEKYLSMSRDAVDRAASLVKRLLTFSRRQRLQPKPVDADGVISGMADLIRRTMGPSVGVELKLRDGAGAVVCDPNELESALLNLCINARDAMPNGGRLAIGTEDVRLSAIERFRAGVTVSDFVAFYVADTGIGMTQDVQERAFEPFFTTKPVGEGTGLGLSQVYGFARQSGGLVRLESGPGHGTVIRLLLPLHGWSEAAVQQPAAKAEEQHATNGEAVLLVDDEDTVRQPAAERLRELGYRVLEAAEGSAALHLLDQGAQFDLLVTDVGLPHGMNGRQLAEAVRDRMPDVMVLFMTGYAATHLPPGTQVIGKPFELDALIGRIQALIEEKRSASAGHVPDLE